MNGDLNPQGSVQGLPLHMRIRRETRSMTKKRQDIYEEGAEVDLKADVIFTLGQRNMQRGAMLDMQRRVLAGDDPTLNNILAQIELDILAQAKRVQGELFDGDE